MAGRMRGEIVLVCAVGVALFAPGLWNRDLWHPLEPPYAQTAHEIVASGDWLLLTLNGEPYYNKPPLFFWLEAAGIKAFGLTTASVRLPSVTMGVGSLVLCYLIARSLGGSGLLSALTLATTWTYVATCQRTSIDATLSCLALLALYLYLRSRQAHRAGWAWGLGAALAAAAAAMTKGPVALLILACAIFPYLIWRGDRREVLHWKWAAALLIVAAVSLAWVVYVGHRRGPEFYRALFGREFAGRLTGESTGRTSVGRYLITFPFEFVPWIVYLPCALAMSWRRRHEPLFMAFLWFVTSFAAFSLIPARAERYLLPLYAPLAMLVGTYVSERGKTSRLVAVSFRMLLTATVLVSLGYSFFVQPHRNRAKSPRPLAMFLKAQGAAADDVVWVRGYEPGVAFYAGFPRMRRLNDTKPLESYGARFVVALKEDVGAAPVLFAGAQSREEFTIGRRTYVVFSARPRAAGARTAFVHRSPAGVAR